MHDEQYYLLKRFSTVDDVAMNALGSSFQWFSFRAKVGTNFDPGAHETRFLSRPVYMLFLCLWNSYS